MIDNIERYETANNNIQDLEQVEIPMNFDEHSFRVIQEEDTGSVFEG